MVDGPMCSEIMVLYTSLQLSGLSSEHYEHAVAPVPVGLARNCQEWTSFGNDDSRGWN